MNSEIYNIFKNKRILFFLIDEKMMIFNTYIAKRITSVNKYISAHYYRYFQPELMPFINEKWFQRLKYNYKIANFPAFIGWLENLDEELPEDFEEKRRIGENDSIICELIRNDSIDEFISYIGKNDVSNDLQIFDSIYETNNFLYKELIQPNEYYMTSLIDYAAFFGAISIFKYLKINNAHIDPLIWLYAIHGNNHQIIHIIEETIQPEILQLYRFGRTENVQSNVITLKFQNTLLTTI